MNNSQNSGTSNSPSGATRSSQDNAKVGTAATPANAGARTGSVSTSGTSAAASSASGAGSSVTRPDSAAGSATAKSAGDTVATVTKTLKDAGEQTRKAAASLATEAGEQAKHLIDEQVSVGAEVADEIARSMRLAADNLASTSPLFAGFARLAADRVEAFSDSVRDQTAEELLATASGYVRERPLIVFGAAATCGFVLFRMLKAVPERSMNASRHRSGEGWPLQPRGDEWVEKRSGPGTGRSFGDTQRGQFHGT